MTHVWQRATSTLLSWQFLLALLILIINDGYLKSAFPGWLTGKLSDFAGIYFVALLGFALAPDKKRSVGLVIATSFAVWKSPLSQPLIDGINSLSPIAVGRVVDYSDLLALLFIPLASLSIQRIRIRRPAIRARQVVAIPVIVATVMATAATSYIWPQGYYSIRNTDPEIRVEEAEYDAAIARVAKRFEMTCEYCGTGAETKAYTGDGLFFQYTYDDTINGIDFEFRVTKMRGFLMRSPDYELYDEFRRQLKSEFGKLSPSMELVQKLSGPEAVY